MQPIEPVFCGSRAMLQNLPGIETQRLKFDQTGGSATIFKEWVLLRLIVPMVVACLASACGPAAVRTNSSPCIAVDRTLTEERKRVVAPVIAKQLRVSNVDVLQSFAMGGWNIIYVDTHESDEAFVFFPGEPGATHYVTLWGGAATEDEEHEIKDWTTKNAPGIPHSLASCFAWHVTRAPHR